MDFLGIFSLLLIGLVVWIVCAYAAYRMARQKHRHATGWGIAGLVFGPFALFALAVLPRS